MRRLKHATLVRRAKEAGYEPIHLRDDAKDYAGLETGYMAWVMPIASRASNPNSPQKRLYWLGWCYRSKEWHEAMSTAVGRGKQLSCGCIFESKAGFKQRRSGVFTKNAPELDKWLAGKHRDMMQRARRDSCGVEKLFDTRLPGVDNAEAVTAFIEWCKWHYGEKFLNIAMKNNYHVHKPSLKGYYIVHPDDPTSAGIQLLSSRAHRFIHGKHGSMPTSSIRTPTKRRKKQKKAA